MLEMDIKYLDKVMNLKNKKDLYNNYFCWLYPFTNENISGYYKKLNINNKKVLTVTSSGDHALNALLHGASHVESFDANPLAKYYSELKCAAIKELSYEEFILFFNFRLSLLRKSKYYFDKTLYNKIKIHLKGDYKEFWDYFFQKYTKFDITSSYLFSNDKLTLNAIIQVNDYLNEKKYYELRNILFSKNIEYHDIDIKDLDKLSKDYDLIILSNVVAYLNNIYGKDFLKKFKQLIDKIKNKHTQIIICYLYANNINDYKFINDVNQNYNYYDIYNPKYVKECFDEEDYEYISFISAEQYELPCCYNDDKILVYNNKTKE